jgi:flagellar motility protein MotE (MotC chaperone)
MSGTDVAEKQGADGEADEEVPRKGTFLAFLRIWLPFPVVLGGILFYQFKSGELDRPDAAEEAEEALRSVFEGAGAELPLLLETLQKERAELQKEWEGLRFAEERIAVEHGEIAARKEEVESLLSRVEAHVSEMETERGQMLDQLARVYETMKPDEAAEILSGIDVDTSTDIIRRMKERNAAGVMASLEPRAAARISQRMLRRP